MPVFTPSPTPPSRSDPSNFAVRGDDFLGWIPIFRNEMDAFAQSLNLISTTDTSSTIQTVGNGAKTWVVSSGKSYAAGMYLVIADAAAPGTNSMWGQVTNYSGTSLTINVIGSRGSGAKTSWVISQSAPGGYGPDNILGTVSQASGVPTGAVIESGSNANGTYVRWADGTQIVWRQLDMPTVALNSGSSSTVLFPVAFANNDYRVADACTGSGGGDQSQVGLLALNGLWMSSKTTSQLTYSTYGYRNGTTIGAGFDLVIVGRWF